MGLYNNFTKLFQKQNGFNLTQPPHYQPFTAIFSAFFMFTVDI